MGNISPFTEHGLEILPLIFSVFCELLPFHIQQNNFIKLFGSIRFNPLPFEIISRITIHLSHVPSSNVGEYLQAAEVNAMLDDPDALFIDMRNHYEYEVGHFENALEIPADTFREQLPKAVEMMQAHKDKKIVMYCTGGIRCEKASAWMKHNGFNKVWHIEGGIIEYARKAREQGLPVRFIGKNFVFDERMGERISDEIIAHCHQCGAPCDSHTNCKNDGCHLLFIQCPVCAEKYKGCCSEICCEESALPPEEQRRRRAGRENGNKIFNKSRGRLNTTLCIPDPTE